MTHSRPANYLEDLAHDLRSPLSTVRAVAEAALLDENLDASTREVLEKIIEEIDSVAGLTKKLYI